MSTSIASCLWLPASPRLAIMPHSKSSRFPRSWTRSGRALQLLWMNVVPFWPCLQCSTRRLNRWSQAYCYNYSLWEGWRISSISCCNTFTAPQTFKNIGIWAGKDTSVCFCMLYKWKDWVHPWHWLVSWSIQVRNNPWGKSRSSPLPPGYKGQHHPLPNEHRGWYFLVTLNSK